MRAPPGPTSAPPRSWSPARRLARLFRAPVERFLAVEAASSVVLLCAATAALVWANTPWANLYEALWTTPLGFNLGPFSFSRDLRWWVNDGLMTVFFFVVGLEIRREAYRGELSELRRAALPIAAALGGMIVPALIYVAFNAGTVAAAGWGVPMATDIAFAVGALTLLGDRVPPALRVLLLALAVIDDVGAIVVIALFYSGGVHPGALGLAGLGLAAIGGLQLFGVRSTAAYVGPALLTWGATYASGVHPTLAGVLIGLATPVGVWLGPNAFADAAEEAARRVREVTREGGFDIQEELDTVSRAAREAISPVERLEHALHGWVAWLVMPLFAAANAGVSLGSLNLQGGGWRVFAGIAVGLAVGKAVGVFTLARLATALGLAALPRGIRWTDITVVGGVAGIGFTMALFIAQLAFPPGPTLETAKLAVLGASSVTGVGGYLLGRWLLPRGARPGAATSAAEGEASTEV
jgi:NhaA family Na+:H+ antiporter